ncbi:hypothetical protein LV84_00408 [Algoriphagus ratkowskyi]|uniref:Uncharacterized protein n=1 Tax=Algoriphagus ratkowskyi TaxID=57028 RepID=A0A2W7RZW5_9BACT|nr:hypothetical protein LV84_00408 [Algoriphagus ratkowskyi]
MQILFKMKKLKIASVLAMGLVLNFLLPFQSGYGQDACTRTDYYNGCGELYWSTGSSTCSNVVIVFLETQCET